MNCKLSSLSYSSTRRAAIILLLSVSFIIGISAYFLLDYFSTSLHQETSSNRKKIIMISKLLENVIRSENNFNKFIFLKDTHITLEDVNDNIDNSMNLLDEIKKTFTNVKENIQMEKFEKDLMTFKSGANNYYLSYKDDPTGSSKDVYEKLALQASDNMKKELTLFEQTFRNNIITIEKNLIGKASSYKLFYLVLLAFTLIIVTLMSIILNKLLRKPISYLIAGTEKIAKGDFSCHLTYEKNDELSKLCEAFNHMSKRLESLEIEKNKNQSSLLEASRMAGMSEVATGVLHNVGNALNSLNITASTISDIINDSSSNSFSKLANLVNENTALKEIFSANEKAKLIPEYINKIHELHTQEKTKLADELASLKKNIAQIKSILSLHQTLNKDEKVISHFAINDLINDARKITAINDKNSGIDIITDYQTNLKIHSDKLKLLLILINIINNAKKALQNTKNKQLTISIIDKDRHEIEIIIQDNGEGIEKENLTKIFQYGFSTDKHSLGFGLHNSALAARTIGGSIKAVSPGLNSGSSFIITIPKDINENYKKDLQTVTVA